MKTICIFLFTCLLFSESKAITFTVSNTSDAGAGSLRQAILDANATALVTDNINFNIPGAGPHTITLLSGLPVVTSPVHISGYVSQTGALQGTNDSRSIRIRINGGGFGLFRFDAGASGSSLSGVALYNGLFNSNGVTLDMGISNVHIWGNYVGLLANGNLPPVGSEMRGDLVEVNTNGGVLTQPYTISNITIGTNGDGTNDANEGNVMGGTTSSGGGDGIEIFSGDNGSPGVITATNIKIAGNYFGLRPDGTTAAQIGQSGASVGSDGACGIFMSEIIGNNFVIGSDGDGFSDVLERNVIANCRQYGLYLRSSSNIDIGGNYIGTDATGTVSNPVGTIGSATVGWPAIYIFKSDDDLSTRAENIVIGFNDTKHTATNAPNVRNVISGNYGRGIGLNTTSAVTNIDARVRNIVVAGNYIGVDATGNASLSNGQVGPTATLTTGAGIGMYSVINSRIGTDGDGDDDGFERNIVSGNSNGAGIFFSSSPFATEGNTIAGNYIGVGANGTTPLGNGHSGIYLSHINGINNNRIGSDDNNSNDAEEANIIANNGGNTNAVYKSGISFVKQAAATGTAINNRFSRNIFYSNAVLPIDLINDPAVPGVTPNDGVTTTGAPNLLLDYPVITSFSLSGTTMSVTGYVSSCGGNEMTAGPSITGLKRIQFYKVADDGDQNGAVTAGCSRIAAHGEGVQYLGDITNITNSFNTTFTLVAGATFTASDKITAIAIDENGNTSEFGVSAQVSITGTVYNDINGTTSIDGSLIHTVTGFPTLYASLYDGSTLVATVPVSASNSTYTFADAAVAGVAYNIVLGTNATDNPTSPFTGTGSGGWVIVGEDCCDNSGNDGIPDGVLSVTPTFTGATNANFGMRQTTNVGIAKTVDNPAPNVGSNVIFTLTANNAGPGAAEAVAVSDVLPAGYTFVSNTAPTAGTFTSGTGEWTIGAMANGATASMTITATVNPSGSYANTATISTTTVDPDPSDNTSTVTPAPVSYSITGSVFNDNNGTTGGANGSLFNGSTTPLFVNLYDAAGSFIASSSVNSSGAYSLTGVGIGTGYQVQVSSVEATTGATLSPNAALPGTYGNISSNGETGSHTDGIIAFDIVATNVSGLDFGIQRPPVADVITNDPSASSAFSATPPAGFPIVSGFLSILYSNLDAFSGTDPEDGIVPIAGNTIKIGTINSNTKVYYDFPDTGGRRLAGGAREVAGNEEIPDFDPAKLVFYGQIGSGDNSTPFGLTYSVRDAAGVFSLSSSTGYAFSTIDPLPVTLSSFTAKKVEGVATRLDWITTAETNSESFDVEHSTDAKIWNVITVITAKGESNRLARYHYTHTDPVAGQNLYRLKMTDLDGTFAHSRIVSLSFDNIAKATFYPNPTTDKVKVKLEDATTADVTRVTLFASDGKVAYTANKLIQGEIDVTDIPTGAYVVTITLRNGTTQNSKILIVK